MTIPAYDPKKKINTPPTQPKAFTPMPGYAPTAQQNAYAASLEREAAAMPKPTGQLTPQLQTMYNTAVQQNGGPLPSGNDSVKGYANAPRPVNMPPMAMSGTSTDVPQVYQDPFARSREDIAQLARDRVQKMLQAGRTSAQGALKGAKTAYDYTNQIEGDQRTLRNFEFKNRNDPFSGQTGYMATNMLRGDAIDDTFQDQNYNNQVGLINQKLADLEAAAPGDEFAIIAELEAIERSTGISVAQLQEQQKNNQYNQSPNNPQNVGQNLQNQLSQLKLNNYPEETRQAAALFEQQLKNGQLDQQTAEFKLKELQDPNSPTNQAAKIDLELKKLEAKYAEPEMKARLNQIRKQTAQIGAAPYKSDLDKQKDQLEVDKLVAEIAKIESGTIPKVEPKDSGTLYYELLDDFDNFKNPTTGKYLTKSEKLTLLGENRSLLTDSDYNKALAKINE